MPRVGTLPWADETDGHLRVRDRLALLIGQGAPTWVGLKVESALIRLGITKPIDLGGVDIIPYVRDHIPRTSITDRATELCSEISEPWLLAHCYRTFAFGMLLGHDFPFDDEKFYLAAMLHDVGLTDAYVQGADARHVQGYTRSAAPCFAVRGSGVARSLADEHAMEAHDRDVVAEAISLHVNVRVKRSQGVEAHLLNISSALDVTGLRASRLGRELVRRVEEEWPREDSFPEDIWTVWACEAAAHPTCRGRLLNVWGRFRHRIYRSHPPQRGDLASP